MRVTVVILLTILAFNTFAKRITLTTGEWPPFSDSSLPQKGFTVEIVLEAAKAAGYEVELVWYPWTRAIHMAESDSAIGSFPWGKDSNRAQIFDFTKPIARNLEKFFYLKNKFPQFKFKGIQSIKGFRFGGTNSYAHLEMMLKENLKVEISHSDRVNLIKLANGRIDFFPINEKVGWELIHRLFPGRENDFATIDTPPFPVDIPLGIAVNRKHPDAAEFIQRFNKGLDKIKNNKKYYEILKRNNIKNEIINLKI